ncbi:MAG: glyoxalase, partial [Thermocrispum sp.]
MRVISVIADIPVGDIGSASGFYADLLGLSVEKFTLGWVARYTSPDTGAHPQLVTRDAPAPENPVVSVKVDDVEAVL